MLKLKYEVYTDDRNTTTEVKHFNSLDEIGEWLQDKWCGAHCYVPSNEPSRYIGFDWVGSFRVRIKDWWNGCTDIWVHAIYDEGGVVKYSDGHYSKRYCDDETGEWLKKIRPIFCKE